MDITDKTETSNIDPSSLANPATLPIPSEITTEGLNEFKSQVKNWLSIDDQILDLQNQIKALKTKKNKILEPKITTFMRTYNISDLNTDSGKVRCNEQRRKKPLNKTNIRGNLSEVIQDEDQLNLAIEKIFKNRETVVTYKLTKPKQKTS
tara:strand:- start:386 stop:835 length:450 start_codon:yes stop_codon:yes gene_type:complete